MLYLLPENKQSSHYHLNLMYPILQNICLFHDLPFCNIDCVGSDKLVRILIKLKSFVRNFLLTPHLCIKYADIPV